MEEVGGVLDPRAELVAEVGGPVGEGGGVEVDGPAGPGEEGALDLADALELGTERGAVEEVRHTDGGGAVGLVGVAGADAALGGSDGVAARVAGEELFAELVLGLVVGHDDVGAGGDDEAGDIHAAGGEGVGSRQRASGSTTTPLPMTASLPG